MSQLEQYKTLTDHLLRQAASQPQQVALQYKYHGAWYFWNWQQLAKRVEQHAAALAADGFSAEDTLWLFSQPHADVLILTLAAQWLGGSVSLLDEALSQDELLQLISPYPNRYVFVENKTQAARWFGLGLPASLVLYRDVSIQHIQQAESISGWLSQHSQIQHAAQPASAQHIALHIYRPNSQQHSRQQNRQQNQPEQLSVLVDRQSLKDIDLLQEAEQLSKHAALKPHDKALATRGFDLAGQWRHLLATWLYAGFTYNFPETLETRDQDRRELQPTFLLGTPENWARLSQLAQQHLPSHRTWLGRWAKQQVGQQPVSTFDRVQQGLVIRPLKQTLGLANVRVALVATSQYGNNQPGDQQATALDADTERLLLALGIQVVPWVDLVQWQPHALVDDLTGSNDHQDFTAPDAEQAFEPALTGSSVRGGV